MLAVLLATHVALAASPQAATAQGPNPYLAQARVLYQGLEYEAAVAKLVKAKTWKSTKPDQVDIAVYLGLCHFQLGDEPAARQAFGDALKLDPAAELPPLTSPKIIQVFESVAAKVAPDRNKPKVPPAPQQQQPYVFGTERTEDRPVPKSVTWPAWTAAGVAAAALTAGIVLGVMAENEASQAKKAIFAGETANLNDSAQRNALLANILFGVGGCGAGAAIVFAATF